MYIKKILREHRQIHLKPLKCLLLNDEIYKQVVISPRLKKHKWISLILISLWLLLHFFASFYNKLLWKCFQFIFFPFMLESTPIKFLLSLRHWSGSCQGHCWPSFCEIKCFYPVFNLFEVWLQSISLSLLKHLLSSLGFWNKPLSWFFYHLTGFSFKTLQWFHLTHSKSQGPYNGP